MFLPILAAGTLRLIGAETPPRFVGAPACASAMCHGGAGELRQQTTIWQKHDIHSRTFNTLVNARSAQIVASLNIADATKSTRCTTCHAPFHDIPRAAFLDVIDPKSGVSCESCHGQAEKWIRPHTRPDYSHRDRVLAGLRDLKQLYVRANSCVACHQTLDGDIASAGHPELIFELDGQAVSEPKHWREKGDWHGPKAWFIGQAVALREMSWQLAKEKKVDEPLRDRWAALLWLMQTAEAAGGTPKSLAGISSDPFPANFARVQAAADTLAREVAESEWTGEITTKLLRQLVGVHSQFRDAKTSQILHARRAERLVLALDRLVAGAETAVARKAEAHVNQLFRQAQSIRDLEPGNFAKAIEALASAL